MRVDRKDGRVDRRCWASLDGHFTGDVLEGGRVDATTWPVQPQQAIDIYFDGKDATYPAGYYRGVIDTATTPSKTGIQKLDVDFPDDRTSAPPDPPWASEMPTCRRNAPRSPMYGMRVGPGVSRNSRTPACAQPARLSSVGARGGGAAGVRAHACRDRRRASAVTVPRLCSMATTAITSITTPLVCPA